MMLILRQCFDVIVDIVFDDLEMIQMTIEKYIFVKVFEIAFQ